jgi:flagellar biosynthesis protein FlhG
MNQASTLMQASSGWLGRFQRLKTVAITSGKGGVGKTNVVVNLGVALANKKVKVAILDADYGLGNIDILLGIEPRHDLNDLINERASLEQILVKRNGLLIIPATSGIQSLTQLTPQQELVLFRELKKLEEMVDILIIDTAAGISDNVISLLLSADEVFLVVSSEPTSIVDSYAVVKVVSELDPFKRFSVIANQVEDEEESAEIFLKISRATIKFLNKTIEYMGAVQHDKKLIESVKFQRPVVEQFPDSRSSQDFVRLARLLQNRIFYKAGRAGAEAGER